MEPLPQLPTTRALSLVHTSEWLCLQEEVTACFFKDYLLIHQFIITKQSKLGVLLRIYLVTHNVAILFLKCLYPPRLGYSEIHESQVLSLICWPSWFGIALKSTVLQSCISVSILRLTCLLPKEFQRSPFPIYIQSSHLHWSFCFFFLNIPQRKKWSFLGRCEYTLETGQRGHAESKCKQKVKAPNFTLFFL